MPLQKGSSASTIGNNIRELHTGKTYAHTSGKFGKKDADRQAVAIAMLEAKGRAFGGVAPQLNGMMSQAMNPAMGNVGAAAPMPSAMMAPQPGMAAGSPSLAGSRGFAQGGVAGGPQTFKGPIVSSVPGRTDKHFTHVPSGSFVIPADIVSGHGQGNTLAGMNTLQKLFKMGPHTGNPSKIPGANPAIKKLAKGGSPSDQHVGKPVPVKLAGGEIVVPPEHVHETMQRVTGKKLTLSQSHQAMDAWVLLHRKKLRKTLAGLPGPARD